VRWHARCRPKSFFGKHYSCWHERVAAPRAQRSSQQTHGAERCGAVRGGSPLHAGTPLDTGGSVGEGPEPRAAQREEPPPDRSSVRAPHLTCEHSCTGLWRAAAPPARALPLRCPAPEGGADASLHPETGAHHARRKLARAQPHGVPRGACSSPIMARRATRRPSFPNPQLEVGVDDVGRVLSDSAVAWG
jgi:hypothetical protein